MIENLFDVLKKIVGEEPVRLPLTGRVYHSSVAVIFRINSGVPEVLFIKRAEHPKDPWSGQMGFPGGREDPDDVNHCDTAVRETLEEVGVDLNSTSNFLGELNEVQARSKMKLLPLILHSFVFWLNEDVNLKCSPEVAETVWIPLSELMAPSNRGMFKIEREEKSWEMPHLDYDGYRIWGLSLVIIHDLLSRLSKTELRDWFEKSLGLESEACLPPPLIYR
jgi:8-oxo-dGTP pyrophosphatase MutT (NUDIX family)